MVQYERKKDVKVLCQCTYDMVEQELNLTGKDFLKLADFTPLKYLGLLSKAKED